MEENITLLFYLRNLKKKNELDMVLDMFMKTLKSLHFFKHWITQYHHHIII